MKPTGALDTKQGNQIMQLFGWIKQRRKTIIKLQYEPEIAAYANVNRHRDGVIAWIVSLVEKGGKLRCRREICLSSIMAHKNAVLPESWLVSSSVFLAVVIAALGDSMSQGHNRNLIPENIHSFSPTKSTGWFLHSKNNLPTLSGGEPDIAEPPKPAKAGSRKPLSSREWILLCRPSTQPMWPWLKDKGRTR